MIFEEEFPDLKDKIRRIKTYSYRDPYNLDFDRVILIEDIQKHCLDKKRVEEAINTVFKKRENTCSAEWMDFANELEKELKLK